MSSISFSGPMIGRERPGFLATAPPAPQSGAARWDFSCKESPESELRPRKAGPLTSVSPRPRRPAESHLPGEKRATPAVPRFGAHLGAGCGLGVEGANRLQHGHALVVVDHHRHASRGRRSGFLLQRLGDPGRKIPRTEMAMLLSLRQRASAWIMSCGYFAARSAKAKPM